MADPFRAGEGVVKASADIVSTARGDLRKQISALRGQMEAVKAHWEGQGARASSRSARPGRSRPRTSSTCSTPSRPTSPAPSASTTPTTAAASNLCKYNSMLGKLSGEGETIMAGDGIKVGGAGIDALVGDMQTGLGELERRLGDMKSELSPYVEQWDGSARAGLPQAQLDWDKQIDECRQLLEDVRQAVMRPRRTTSPASCATRTCGADAPHGARPRAGTPCGCRHERRDGEAARAPGGRRTRRSAWLREDRAEPVQYPTMLRDLGKKYEGEWRRERPRKRSSGSRDRSPSPRLRGHPGGAGLRERCTRRPARLRGHAARDPGGPRGRRCRPGAGRQ